MGGFRTRVYFYGLRLIFELGIGFVLGFRVGVRARARAGGWGYGLG